MGILIKSELTQIIGAVVISPRVTKFDALKPRKLAGARPTHELTRDTELTERGLMKIWPDRVNEPVSTYPNVGV